MTRNTGDQGPPCLIKDAVEFGDETWGSPEEARQQAYQAWCSLNALEQHAEAVGGREFHLLVMCCRDILERRWGRRGIG